MRASLAIALAQSVTLTGCPALLSDWTIREDSDADAASDSGSLRETGGASSGSGSSGSSAIDGSLGTDAGGGAGGMPVPDSGTEGDAGPAGGWMSSGGATASGGFSSSGSGGAGGTGDACMLVTHSNGTGQTWQDCVPLGTYTEVQARKACAAYVAEGSCGPCGVGLACGAGHDYAYCTHPDENGLSSNYLWFYAGPNAGRASTAGCVGELGWE